MEKLFSKKKFTLGKFTIFRSPRTIFLTRLRNTLKALWLKYVRKYERFREVMSEMKSEETFSRCKKLRDKLLIYMPRYVINLEITMGQMNALID